MNITKIRDNIKKFYKKKKEAQDSIYHVRHNTQWNKYYQKRGWKELRTWYKTIHPICEICERNGIVTPTDEIHHLRVFSSGIDEADKLRLLLDPNNVCSTCLYHHRLFHELLRKKQLSYVSIDDLITYEEEKNKYNK